MTESFATSIRGTAVGGAYNAGRIGAMFAPAIIGAAASGGSIGLGFLIMGGAYFLCGAVSGIFIKDRQYDPQKHNDLLNNDVKMSLIRAHFLSINLKIRFLFLLVRLFCR